MASIFDIPAHDVIFVHLFSYLGSGDVWRLREVCRELFDLCWDYFINVCLSIRIKSAVPPHQGGGGVVEQDTSLRVGAGSAILKRCRKIQDVHITDSAQLDREIAKRCLSVLLSSLIESEIVLKRFCLRLLNAGSMLPLLDDKHLGGVAIKCQQLLELEISGIPMKGLSAQYLLSKLLQHCKNTLEKLSIQCLDFCPDQTLPVPSLTKLRYFSVAYCNNVSSEGNLEEVFRKCVELEVVDLRGVRVVNERSLFVLAEYCTRLKELFVEGCPLVTSESLIKLQHVITDITPSLKAARNNKTSMKILGQI